jgi:hypothetical protein
MAVPNLYLIGGTALVIAALSGALYIEHQRGNTARAERSLAERDRDGWKQNAEAAQKAAANNLKALDEYKAKAEESAVLAELAKAEAAAAEKRAAAALAKLKEQHVPTDSSPFMRAFLDGLCRDQTTAACPNY